MVLLLHGLGHSTHGWRKVVDPIAAAGYRVMAVDLPGFGYSDKPGGYSLDSFVGFVRDWLDLHCVERCALVGNSMGGLITAASAGALPERVAAAVLVDPAGFGSEASLLVRVAGLRLLRRALGARFTPRRVRRALRIVFADPSLIEDAEIERIVELSDLPGGRHAMMEIGHKAVGLRGLRPAMGLGTLPEKITPPTLIVWGSHDRVVPLSHAALVEAAIPGAQLSVLEGVGHCPQLEAPERFLETVLPFLRMHLPPRAQVAAPLS